MHGPCYCWVIFGLFPLNRESLPLPADPTHWPSVDIFIPTYNEPLSVVQNTVYGALAMNWPEDKITIWLLDDGGREAFCRFAEETGIRYVARSTHEHAKAGNINHALTLAKVNLSLFLIATIFLRYLLQRTMGWFLADEKLAMMQTPHHFFLPDPF